MLETGFELLANFPRIHSSCLLESWGYAQGTRERLFARGRKDPQYTVSFTAFRVPFTALRYGGAEFWCFLLADLSVGVQTAARAPFCPSLQVSTGSQREGVPSWRGRLRTKTSQVNRPEQHSFPECVHDHGLVSGTHFHHLCPEAVYVLFQGLPLILLYVEKVVRNWGWGPVS